MSTSWPLTRADLITALTRGKLRISAKIHAADFGTREAWNAYQSLFDAVVA